MKRVTNGNYFYEDDARYSMFYLTLSRWRWTWQNTTKRNSLPQHVYTSRVALAGTKKKVLKT